MRSIPCSVPSSQPSPRRALAALAVLLLFALPAAADETAGLPSPPVVGVAQTLRIVPDLSTAAAAGERQVWRHQLQVPGAAFLKPSLVDLDLRPGDELVIRSGTGRVVETLTGRGPKDRGTFWGLSAFGDTLVFELSFARPYDRLPFVVDQVIVGDPAMLADASEGAIESICPPEDFEDVICYDDDPGKWANVTASVGVMTVGGNPAAGALWCSGSNVSPDNYVLTNHHCIANNSQCASAEFVFRYYRTACNVGAGTTPDWQSFRCDEVVAFSPIGSCSATLASLDFSLSSVIGDPASTFGWVTPDPTPLTSGEDVYIVQHPDGRPHEITHGGGADVVVDGTNLRYYDTHDTEGGSSGSPIFRDSDDLLVGLHHCGGCTGAGGNTGMLMSDIYPHIAPFLAPPAVPIFSDDFESGDASGWSLTSP